MKPTSTPVIGAPDTAPRILEHQGCRLAYEVRGTGPPVLFIQGVGVHGAGWTPQVEALSDTYGCLWFDNRGMGRSGRESRGLSVRSMADDALALIRGQGWDSAHVVGHSLGGLVAVELALAHPTAVRSLALLCTVGRGRDATRLSRRMLWLGLRSRFGTRKMRRRAFLEIVMPPEALGREDRDELAARLEPLFGHDLGDQPAVAADQLRALRAYDATDRLHELRGLPTLVLSAPWDPIAPPRFGRALAEGIAGARYVEVPGASHGVTIQRAEQVNELLREHLDAAEAVGIEESTSPPR